MGKAAEMQKRPPDKIDFPEIGGKEGKSGSGEKKVPAEYICHDCETQEFVEMIEDYIEES